MANLTIIALTLAALVAFDTAHTTIITTTIEDENPISEQRQCSQRLQGQRLNQCRMFLMKGQINDEEYFPQMAKPEEVILQYCCQELQNIEEPCQCEAVKRVYRDVKQQLQQQQGPHFGPFGFQKIQKSKQKAQVLPNLCNLHSKQCQIGTIEGSNRFRIPF
ncbi:putative bifunctional inhibitor/plant lipid transfer protein/seed storage helical [Helianthus annuus]|uniref:Bifunctional inhibitor/plant lipid transfer protein/seed storage helical n=1 Tax=Helianthus annuus TaxID=4232 RepID=A0A159B8K6_HELAN|nr:2S seed storage protein-like [Helianthus annuus]AKM13303.1 seed storage albumin 9 precursor [Helianthus annuus]KAF5781581.1 putative bifunctional inhibitor/plant lipid transfer protein/seed storage helical [Helianthus annuus]KAJ0501154.1 putative AAI/SS protein [Helianthus annuus]KAJ0508871.1 putative bifunctional inhibitor/plant lipid transfer protein/seed storage helical [Helianthus annuus]KAJ0517048.1 putative AAI/SS protein [Helianthus annuus]